MWPETVQGAKDLIDDMTARAAKFGRTLKYRFPQPCHRPRNRSRSPRLCRPAAVEARRAARRGDPQQIARRANLRRRAAGGTARGRGGATTAISRTIYGPASAAPVPAAARQSSATPTRCSPSCEAYQAVGIEAFILSGYPHINECDMFARYVLPTAGAWAAGDLVQGDSSPSTCDGEVAGKA